MTSTPLMSRARGLLGRTTALAVAGAVGGYFIANAYVSYRYGGALTYFDPWFLGGNAPAIHRHAPDTFWTSAAIIGGLAALLPAVPSILTAGHHARAATTRAKQSGTPLDTKGRAIAGAVALGAFGAVTGYVLASAYVTYRIGGSLNAIDFTFLARNAVPMLERAPQTFWTAAAIVGGSTVIPLGLVSAHALNEKLTTYGTTHWQTRSEIKKNGYLTEPGHGFVLGKLGDPKSRQPLLVSKQFPHALMLAPTGRGKGVGFVIPNVLLFKGSVVVLDVKGEIFEATSRHRQSMGDRVIRFAPLDWSRKSHRYNPLQRIADMKDLDQQMMELDMVARLFLVTSNETEGLLDGGIELFVACGMLAFEMGTPTLGAIYKLATQGGNKQDAYKKLAGHTKYQPARDKFINLGSINDKTLTSYLSVLSTAGLSLWANPHVQRLTDTTDFSFRDIRRIPHAIYFEVPPTQIKTVAALARLFFTDLNNSLHANMPGEDEPGKVMIVLDEFHKLGKMEELADSISTLRGYGGHMAIITQSVPQIDEIYGKNLRLALQSSGGVKLYFTPSDEMTVAEVSALLGKTTRRVVSKSRPLGMSPLRSRTVSERTEEAPLMSEDQVRRMDLDDVIIALDAHMPIRARRIKWHEDPALRAIHDAQTGELPWPPVVSKDSPKPTGQPKPNAVAVVNEGTPPALVAKAAASDVPSTPQQAPANPEPAPVEQAKAAAVMGPPALAKLVASARRAVVNQAQAAITIQPLEAVVKAEDAAAMREAIRRIEVLLENPDAVLRVRGPRGKTRKLVVSARRAVVDEARPAIFIQPVGITETPEDEAAVHRANSQVMRLEDWAAAMPVEVTDDDATVLTA